MNDKYIATEQAQDTPVVSLASNWEELRKTTGNIVNIAGKYQETKDKMAVQANKYTIAAHVMDLTTEAKMEASKQMNPVDAAKTYKAVVQGGSEGIAQHVLAVNEPYAKEVMAFKVDQAKQDLSGAIATRAKQDAYTSFTNSYDTFSNEMANAANRGDKVAAATLYGQAKGLVAKTVGSGALDPVRGGVFTQKLQKGFHTNIVIGQYRNAVATGDGVKFKKDFMKSKTYDAYLNPRDKQALMAKFSSMDKTAAAVDGINSATYDPAAKQQIYNGKNGIPINQRVMADLAASNPNKFQKTLGLVREGQATYLIVSKFDDASIPAVKAGIAELENPENVAKTYQEQAVKLDAANRLKTKLKTLYNDPASAAVGSAAYQAVIKQQKARGTLDPLGARIAYQKHLGMEDSHISALTNAEAYDVVSHIKQQKNLQTQLAAMNAYSATLKPANRPYVMRDLQKAGLPLASQHLLRIASDPAVSRYAVDAAQAWNNIQMVKGSEDYKKAMDAYSGVLSTKYQISIPTLLKGIDNDSNYTKYANVIISSGGDVTKRLSDYKNHFELLTMQFMTKGKTQDDAVKLTNEVMNAGTSIDSFRGSKYIYDKTLDSSLVTGACSSSIAKYKHSGDITIPKRYQASLAGVDRKDMLDHYMSSASFINTPDQTGLVMVDENQNPILDKSGKKITFSFKDLHDGSSEISKQALHTRSIVGTSLRDIMEGDVKDAVARSWGSESQLASRSPADMAKRGTHTGSSLLGQSLRDIRRDKNKAKGGV